MENTMKLVGKLVNIEPTKINNAFYVDIDTSSYGVIRSFCINPDLKEKLQPGVVGLFSGRISTKKVRLKKSKKFIYQNSFILTDFVAWRTLPERCCNIFSLEGKLLHVMPRSNSVCDFLGLQIQSVYDSHTYRVALLTRDSERFSDLVNHVGEVIRVRGFERTRIVDGRADNVHVVSSFEVINQKDEEGGDPLDY